MSDLGAIKEGIETRLATIGGLRVYRYESESINELPAAVVRSVAGSYTRTYGGSPLDGEMTITVLVGNAQAADAWTALDAYISSTGAKSVVRAIADDQTLGLPDVAAAVVRFENAGRRQINDAIFIGVDFIVRYISAGG